MLPVHEKKKTNGDKETIISTVLGVKTKTHFTLSIVINFRLVPGMSIILHKSGAFFGSFYYSA